MNTYYYSNKIRLNIIDKIMFKIFIKTSNYKNVKVNHIDYIFYIVFFIYFCDIIFQQNILIKSFLFVYNNFFNILIFGVLILFIYDKLNFELDKKLDNELNSINYKNDSNNDYFFINNGNENIKIFTLKYMREKREKKRKYMLAINNLEKNN